MDKARILVAEDEGIIAKDLENTLKGMGYAVSGTASSGEEAIRKALETRPDLVLMDVVLRGNMDGVAAAEEIQARLGIPVIFLTAYADEKTLQRAKISGPFGYMLKPFEERELRGAIEVALNRHEMEKKLKKSAEEWRSTFDSIQDWVSIHDCNFRIVRVNRAMAGAFRRAPQDMIGKTCYQVFHRSNEPIPQCPHRRALEARRPALEEFFDPGLGIYLEISTSPIFDEKGELTGTVHIAKDISERKKAEEDLRKSEEGARRLARENMVMAEIGRIISSSPRIEEIYDRFAEKVRSLVSFDRLAVNLINGGGKDFFIPYVARREIEGRRSGEKIPLAGTAAEEVARTRSSLLLRKKDEAEILERFPGLRPVFEAGFREMILVPMIASGGCVGVLNLQSFREGAYGRGEVEIAEKVADQIAGAVANARLHRQTIETQEALRESEERYRRLFEGIPIGLYRSTPAGKLLDANPAIARLFGYPDADSLRQLEMADTYVDPRDRERFKTLMEEKGRVEQFRVERRRRDGSRFWVETHSLAVHGPDGAIQYYEGSVQDVSDRQAFEEKLGWSENHARQLALEKTILAEIGRIISSTTDIEEVYKSFAWEVKKLIPFDRLIVTLVERGKGTMINRFIEGTSVPGRNMGDVFPLRGTFGEAVIESRQGFLLQVENEEETVLRFPGLLLDIRAGLKSALSVPLFYRDEAVGVLHIFSGTGKAYNEKDLATARSIADQIAGTVVNAQLFLERKKAEEALRRSEEESKRLAHENLVIAEIGRIISSTLNIETVYERFGDEVRKLISYDRMSINVIDYDRRSFIILYVSGPEVSGRRIGEPIPLSGTATEEIVRTGSSLLFFHDEKEAVDRLPGLRPLFKAGFQSIMMIPLISRKEVIGTLLIQSTRPHAYTERELKLAERVGDQIAGAIASAQSFDELKRAEESVKRTKDFYVTVINSMKDSLSIIDVHDYRIVDVNRALLDRLGLTREETIGKTCHELTHRFSAPCNSPEHGCPLLLVRETGKAAVAEHLYHGEDGVKSYVEVSASPIRDDDGKIIQIVHLEKDVTEQKNLQSQLVQVQKLEAVGQLAAGIAHEINTPTQYVGDNARFLQDSFRDLNAVLGKCGRLLEAVKSGEDGLQAAREVEETIREIDLPYLTGEIPRAIQQTLEGVERVTKIVRAMKEFSHPGVKEKTIVDLNKAIENTVTVCRHEWKYVAEMILELEPSLPQVPCLLGEFNQVVLNIVINAAQAIADVVGDGSGGKGEIRVVTRQEGDGVEVRISDTGGGIPENIRSRIFDPFFTTKTVGKGTGQGLAIAHSIIVEKHGGTIHFKTEMGKGTTFIIRLPVAPEEKKQ